MKYAEYDKNGNIIAYCTDQKDNMVLIPEDLQGNTPHKDYLIVNGEFVLKSEAPDNIDNDVIEHGTRFTDVNAYKKYLIKDINVLSERSTIVTPGKEYIYKAKEDEANAYLSATDPDIDDYPFIKNEANVRGITPIETAQLFKAKAQVAKEQLAIIEANRQRKIIAINTATTIDEVEQAYRA